MTLKLIYESDESIAVTDSGVTVIDWLDVRRYDSYLLLLDNLSANAIASIAVDSSPDAGATTESDVVTIDPSSVGPYSARQIAFELTAGYIRVRAAASELEQSAVKAKLFAKEAAGYLCTLADVKDRLTITDSSHDSQLNRIISSTSSMFDSYCQRPLLYFAPATEYYSSDSKFLLLKRYPIIAIDSVKVALDYNFASAESLTNGTGFFALHGGQTGELIRIDGSRWHGSLPGSIEVTYHGGYCPAGVEPADGQYLLPADLREAAILQSCFIFQRRDAVGVKSSSFNGASFDSYSPMALLPIATETLDNYKRRSHL